MSQRPVIGQSSGRVIGVVREHGSRVECIALVPWLVRDCLDHIAGFWTGDFPFRADNSPGGSALHWFR